MENNEIANVDNSFISRIIKKIILFFKKKNKQDESDNSQYVLENNSEFIQEKNNGKKNDFRADLKFKDKKTERLEYLKNRYEQDENSIKEFSDEEIEELTKLYKSESAQLRKEIKQSEQRLNDKK